MYYANYSRAKKRLVSVSLVTSDGKSYEGVLFITGDQRVKDHLNGPEKLIAFETTCGVLHLLNRKEISRVIPHDDADGRRTTYSDYRTWRN